MTSPIVLQLDWYKPCFVITSEKPDRCILVILTEKVLYETRYDWRWKNGCEYGAPSS